MGVQVSTLTQNVKCVDKQFIDFEFDGKHVSEFGWVAVVSGGDRHLFDASPSFEDETSEVNGVSGQYYWGTRFKTYSRTYELATDGVTEAEIDAFKLHFIPGKYGKFVEDKLLGRYCYCRVSAVVSFKTVPFKKEVEYRGKKIVVNEYKGSCSITFQQDFPFFYGEDNYFAAENEDNLRLSYINHIPFPDSWTNAAPLLVGDEVCCLSSGEVKDKQAVSLSSPISYYNPSTAPTRPIISLSLKHSFTRNIPSADSLIYFSTIKDEINFTSCPYNEIRVKGGAKESSSMRYTSPDVIYSINRAIQLAGQYYSNNSVWIITELEELLRQEIVNSKVIGWAIAQLRLMMTIEAYYNSTGQLSKGITEVDLTQLTGYNGKASLNWLGYFNIAMLSFFANYKEGLTSLLLTSENLFETTVWPAFQISFDSENSQASITYSYNQIDSALTKITTTEKQSGDMMLSNYIILEGGDTLNGEGKIASTHQLEFLQGGSTFAANILNSIDVNYKYTYL